MSIFGTTSFTGLALVALAVTASPATAQDLCSSPTVISGIGSFSYDRTANTSSAFNGGDAVLCESAPYGAPSRDQFWSWTVVTSGNYQIDNCGEGNDTELNVHLGGDCSATCLLNNADGVCGALTGENQMNLLGAAAGQVFLIQLGDWVDTSTGPAVGFLNITPLPASPSNDTCASPDVISGMGPFQYDRSMADSSGFDGGVPAICAQTLGAEPPTRDVFFAWTATASGDVQFDNCSEGANTGMNVHVGNDCSATCLTTNDDGPCATMGESSVILAGVQNGDQYLIQIGNWDSWSSSGNLGLLVVAPASLPTGNDCSSAAAVSGLGSFPYDRTFATTTGFTAGSVNCETAQADSGPYRDVFFAWTAAMAGQFRFDNCGEGTDTIMNVYDGGDCSATCLAFGDGSPCQTAGESSVNVYNVAPGDVYLVQIGDWSNNNIFGGLGSLNVTLAPAPPANDTCATPSLVTGLGTFAYDRTNASSTGFDGGDSVVCNNAQTLSGSRDVFLAWTSTVAGDVTFDNCGDGIDTVMNVHVGGDCNATCLASNDLGPCQTASESLVAVTGVQAGDVYLIQIADWSNSLYAGATGNLNVSLTPGPPANDDCSTAQVISGVGSWPHDRTYATTSGFNGGDAVLCQVGMGALPPQNDVFFAWTSNVAGAYQFDNCGDGANTQMTVHLGGDCSATCLASNSTGPCGVNGESVVTLAGVPAGVTYLIALGGWGQTQFPGPGSLNVTLANPPPANDTCASPSPIQGEGSFAFDTTDSTTSGFIGGNLIVCSPGQGLTPPNSDVFYQWTAGCDGDFMFSICGQTLDSTLSVHAGTGCSATCLVAGGNTTCPGGSLGSEVTVLGAASGAQYLVQVGGWMSSIGAGTMEVVRLNAPCLPGGTITVACDPANQHYQGGSVTLESSSFGTGVGSDLRVEATDGPVGEFGFVLISSDGSANVSVFNGILCLATPQGRYNTQVSINQGLPQLNSLGQFDANGVMQNIVGTSGSGSGFDVPLELPYAPGGQVIGSQETWFFQVWFRDQIPPLPNPGSSSNFSNTIEVFFP